MNRIRNIWIIISISLLSCLLVVWSYSYTIHHYYNDDIVQFNILEPTCLIMIFSHMAIAAIWIFMLNNNSGNNISAVQNTSSNTDVLESAPDHKKLILEADKWDSIRYSIQNSKYNLYELEQTQTQLMAIAQLTRSLANQSSLLSLNTSIELSELSDNKGVSISDKLKDYIEEMRVLVNQAHDASINIENSLDLNTSLIKETQKYIKELDVLKKFKD